MLAAAKKGRPVNEAEIPPPVATGAQSTSSGSAVPWRPAPPIPSPPPSDSSPSEQPLPSGAETPSEEQSPSSGEPALSAAPSPEEPTEEPAGQPPTAGLEYRLWIHTISWHHYEAVIRFSLTVNCNSAFKVTKIKCCRSEHFPRGCWCAWVRSWWTFFFFFTQRTKQRRRCFWRRIRNTGWQRWTPRSREIWNKHAFTWWPAKYVRPRQLDQSGLRGSYFWFAIEIQSLRAGNLPGFLTYQVDRAAAWFPCWSPYSACEDRKPGWTVALRDWVPSPLIRVCWKMGNNAVLKWATQLQRHKVLFFGCCVFLSSVPAEMFSN